MKKKARKRPAIDPAIAELALEGLIHKLDVLRSDITNTPMSSKDRLELLKGLLACNQKLSGNLRKELERRGMSADEIRKQVDAAKREMPSTKVKSLGSIIRYGRRERKTIGDVGLDDAELGPLR